MYYLQYKKYDVRCKSKFLWFKEKIFVLVKQETEEYYESEHNCKIGEYEHNEMHE
jgi:hypothetical protein